jgi:hypothetical protein
MPNLDINTRYFNKLCGSIRDPNEELWRYRSTERSDDYPHSILTKIPRTTETLET